MKIFRIDYEIDRQKQTRLIAWGCEEIKVSSKSGESFAELIKPKIVGFVDLRHEGMKSARFFELWVPKEFREKGNGRQLLEECEAIARESDCQTIGCCVELKNEDAQEFYKKCGYSFAWEFVDDDDRIMIKKL